MPATASQDDVRRQNLGVLLRFLHLDGAASRAELTARTGLNRSTVKALTSDLLRAGLVTETAPSSSGGGVGRPSIVVAPQTCTVVALAVSIGVDALAVAAVGLGGRQLARAELRQGQDDYAVQRTIGRVCRLVRAVLREIDPAALFIGVGVAVCGVVGGRDHLVRFAPNLGWTDVPLGALIGAALGTGLPVAIGNDADLGAMSEHLRGAAAGVRDAIFVSAEVGIGGGIILGGRPMGGAGGYGGEVGHMVVNPAGRLCRCGRRGCWETEIGEAGILLSAGRSAGDDVDDVLRACVAGDADALAGIARVGHWLGVGVVNLVNLFNPEVIVFGGTLRDILPLTHDAVLDALGYALAAPRQQVRLELPALGADSILAGAAELAFTRLLADPLGIAAEAAVLSAVHTA